MQFKMNTKFIYALILLFMPFTALRSQSPFKASVMAGINLSQVDGDYQRGYDRASINFGVRGGFRLNQRFDIMSELFYTEKGTKPKNLAPASKERNITIDMTYAEIPITVNVHSKPNEQGFYNWTAHAGLSYGRLLKSNSTLAYGSKKDTIGSQSFTQDAYKQYDLALVWGLSYNIRPHIGVRLQQSFSLSKFFINPIPKLPNDPRYNDDSYRFYRNYFVSAQFYYDFFAPKYKAIKKKR
jgi:Outer membrane protein beta-barrel domain